MGIHCGNLINYIVNDLSLSDLFNIAKFRSQRRSDSCAYPMVDIDASWIVRRFVGVSYEQRILYLFQLIILLLNSGFAVTVICDGEKRHHTKRATTKRFTENYQMMLDHQRYKCMLIQCCSSSHTNNITSEEKEKLEKKIKSLERKLNEPMIDVGNELFNRIISEVQKLTGEFNDIDFNQLEILQAEFQADSVIAYRSIRTLNDVVFSSDTDQSVLVAGDCCCVNVYKLIHNNNKKSLENVSLFSPSRETILSIVRVINISMDSPKIKLAKYPIFDHVFQEEVRALFAVGIGCDVYLSGIKNITPRVIFDFMNQPKNGPNETPTSLYDQIIQLYTTKKFSKNNLNNDEVSPFCTFLNVLVQSYLFEPANFRTSGENINQQSNNLYIHGKKPLSLHPYNEDFYLNGRGIVVNDDIIVHTSVDCCFDVARCVGVGDGRSHIFMKQEGMYSCRQCQCCVCYT